MTSFQIHILLSHFSRVWLCATPSLWFSRQEHWSGLPFLSPMDKSEKWKWSRSIMSDSSQPHGLQPTRLLCPWDFPGKSTGVGCHCHTSTHKKWYQSKQNQQANKNPGLQRRKNHSGSVVLICNLPAQLNNQQKSLQIPQTRVQLRRQKARNVYYQSCSQFSLSFF